MLSDYIEKKYGSFFETDNIDNILWKKNKKDLFNLFYINNYVNTKKNHKYTLKLFYKYQFSKQIKKVLSKK